MTEEKIQQADVHLAAGDGQVPSAASRGETAPCGESAPTQPEPLLGEREAFEAAYRRLYPITCEHSPGKFEQGSGSYFDSTVMVAWALWQARAQRPSESQGHGAPTGQSVPSEAREATSNSNEPDEKDSTPVADKGPWEVNEWDARIVLQSHDFTHDAALIVSGDFASRAQKLQYANNLAAQLNDQQRAKGYTASLLPLPQPTGERE